MVSMAAAPAAVSTVVPATKQYGELTAPEIAPVIVPVIKPVAAPSKAACPAPFQLPVVIRCVAVPDSDSLLHLWPASMSQPTRHVHDFLLRPAALQQASVGCQYTNVRQKCLRFPGDFSLLFPLPQYYRNTSHNSN